MQRDAKLDRYLLFSRRAQHLLIQWELLAGNNDQFDAAINMFAEAEEERALDAPVSRFGSHLLRG